jgi:hypothetical protein
LGRALALGVQVWQDAPPGSLVKLVQYMFAYRLYGLSLRSQWPLPCSKKVGPVFAEVEFSEGPVSLFAAASQEAESSKDAAGGPQLSQWLFRARLRDGSDYLRWDNLFEFVISGDGRSIFAHMLGGSIQDIYNSHVLQHLFFFTLLKWGMEPLHSTTVVIDDGAVAFIGDSGYGKSTLGAAFCLRGHPILADDLLTVKEESHGFFGYPGRSRIRLLPETATVLFEDRVKVMSPDPYSRKLTIPLDESQTVSEALPLRAIYVVRPSRAASAAKRVTIRPLRQRRAFLCMIANMCNPIAREPERLTRLFHLSTRLCARLPVKSLSYPRDLSRLPEVVDIIRANIVRRPRPITMSQLTGACP